MHICIYTYQLFIFVCAFVPTVCQARYVLFPTWPDWSMHSARCCRAVEGYAAEPRPRWSSQSRTSAWCSGWRRRGCTWARATPRISPVEGPAGCLPPSPTLNPHGCGDGLRGSTTYLRMEMNDWVNEWNEWYFMPQWNTVRLYWPGDHLGEYGMNHAPGAESVIHPVQIMTKGNTC